MTSALLLFDRQPSAQPLAMSDMTGLEQQYRQEKVICGRQVQHIPTQPTPSPSLAQPCPYTSTTLLNPGPPFSYSGSDLPPLEPSQHHFPSDLGLPQLTERDFYGRTLYPYQTNLVYQYVDPLAPQTLNEFPFPSDVIAPLSTKHQQPLSSSLFQQPFDDQLFSAANPDSFHLPFGPHYGSIQNTDNIFSQPCLSPPAVVASPTMPSTNLPSLLHLPQRPIDRLVPTWSAPVQPLAQQPLRPSLRQNQSYNPPYPSPPDFSIGIDPLQMVGYGQGGTGTAGMGAGGSLGHAAASTFTEVSLDPLPQLLISVIIHPLPIIDRPISRT
jgi:hypothetical protein